MKNYHEDINYIELVTQWTHEKRAEQQANARRLIIERKILDMISPDLKESGTNNFPNGLKVLTGLATVCDGTKVNNLYQKFINNQLGVTEFPFKHKWEPETKMLKELNEKDSYIYNKFFAETLTIKPKKPAFEVKKSELN